MVSRRRRSKARAQRAHAQRRLRERYGIEATRTVYTRIIDQIQAGLSAFVERQSWRRSVHVVEVEGQTIAVVYDRKRKELCTALPPDAVEERGDGWCRLEKGSMDWD